MGRAGPLPHTQTPSSPAAGLCSPGRGVPRPTSRGSDTRTPAAALLCHRASQRTSREVSALLHDRLARTAARMKCLCMLEHKTRELKSCVRTAREKGGGGNEMVSGKYYCTACAWQRLVPASCSVIPLLLLISLRPFCPDSIPPCLPTLQTAPGVTLPPPQDALQTEDCLGEQREGKKG